MKIMIIVIIVATILFYPKAYFIFKYKEGLILDCQCLGMEMGSAGRQWGVNPDNKKICYGIPTKCETRKISWYEYIKSDWALVTIILSEIVLFIAYNIADKNAHKEGLSG